MRRQGLLWADPREPGWLSSADLALPQDGGPTPLATAFSTRPASRSAGRGAADQQVQGLLAAKESEAALLRQQLAQLTADFKFNLRVGCCGWGCCSTQ